MKNGNLYLFQDINGLELLVGSLSIREIFVNKSFIKQGYILIDLSHDMKKRQEVLWKNLQSHIVKGKEFTVPSFTKEYVKEIGYVYRFKEKTKTDLSWLEIFQIAAILRLEDDKTIEVVEQIYDELKKFTSYANRMY